MPPSTRQLPSTDEEGLRLLVLDPELAIAQALAQILRQEERVLQAEAAASAGEVVDLLDTGPYVLVVHDSDALSRTVTLVSRIAQEHPEVPLLVLSNGADPSTLARLVRAGARGWVDDSAQVEEVVRAAEGVAAGQWWMPRDLLGRALRDAADDSSLGLDLLTSREREVLDALAEGLTRQQIADRLSVSVNTVRTHIQHLLVRLGVHTTLEAVSVALRLQRAPRPTEIDLR